MGTRISQSRNRTSGLSILNKAVFPVSLNQVGTVTIQVDFEDEAEEGDPEEEEPEEGESEEEEPEESEEEEPEEPEEEESEDDEEEDDEDNEEEEEEKSGHRLQ